MVSVRSVKASRIQQPKVSIIIPCYNGSKFIENCLNSIFNQTIFNKIELIIIDDCSTDNSLPLIKRLTKTHNNVFVGQTSQQSGSPGIVRNLGLKIAKAPYVLFVDGDDWLDTNVVEALYQQATENNADITFLNGFYNHLEDDVKQRYYKKNYVAVDGPLRGFHESFMLWDKMFRKDFILENNLLIEHLQASEEIFFIIRAYYYAKNAAVTSNCYGYHYRRFNEESITNSKRKMVYPSFEFDAWHPVDEWVKQHNVDQAYQNIILLRKVLSFKYALSIVNQTFYEQFLKEVKDYISYHCYFDVLTLAKQLGYEDAVNEFFALYEDYSNAKGIIFGPDWSKSNPYQSLLYDAIKTEHGIYSTGFAPKQLTKEYLKSKRQHCGVLHLHWLHAFYDVKNDKTVQSFIDNLAYAKTIGYRVVWTAHNLLPHENDANSIAIHKYVRQQVIDLCDHIISHDKTAKKALLNTFKISANKINIAPHGLYNVSEITKTETQLKREFGLPGDSFVLLLLGRIRKYKGIDKAIEAFKKSFASHGQHNAYLIVAGAPDDFELDKLISKEANENNHIKYIRGEISQLEVDKLFKLSTLSLLPYEAGMTSGVSYMSLSHKKPMLVTPLPFLQEFANEHLAIAASFDNMPCAMQYLYDTYQSNMLQNMFDLNQATKLEAFKWSNIVQLEPYCLFK